MLLCWGLPPLRKGVHLPVSASHPLSLWLSVLNCKLFFLPSFSFSLCQWRDSKITGAAFPLGKKQPQCLWGPLTPAWELVTLWSLLTSHLLSYFLWYILQKPTLGREGPVASLLHCRRATLAFQSIYYEIKWIPLGLIPCCNCNEKKQFLTLHLRSITIKIHWSWWLLGPVECFNVHEKGHSYSVQYH